MVKRPMISRRRLLSAGLVCAAGGGLTVAATQRKRAQSAEPVQHPYIDAHAHIWTREIEKFPLAAGQTLDNLNPPSFTARELLDVANPHGVGRVVLIQHHIFHGMDNGYLIDAAARHPGLFKVVGMVDDSQPHPDVLMRKLLPRHVTAFRVTPSIRSRDRWLDGEGMAAIWRCAADTRQAICGLINPEDLPALDAMCGRYPDTPVVIDHLARIGITGQVDEADLARLCKLARHKHTFVKVSAFYALGKKQPPYKDLLPMIRRVYEAYGAERLMWASDCPYQLSGRHTYGESIALIRDHLDFASPEDREWLLGKTAERVFFLPT